LEKTVTSGLGWIAGDVVALQPADPSLRIPHMGWNTLDVMSNEQAGGHAVLKGIETGAQGWHAYFVHSYHLAAQDPHQIVATASYGMNVTALVARDTMVGTQFHPEKSQKLGLKLIANFLQWVPK
jgi:imidazole glycerol-phosphate synthase subunit HisH